MSLSVAKLTIHPIYQTRRLQRLQSGAGFVVFHQISISKPKQLHAIGGGLSQEGHLMIYVLRKFSASESRCSNIEREALAIACHWLSTTVSTGTKF